MRTIQLSSAAHALGDEYYRRTTREALTKDTYDQESFELATTYLSALEGLLSHLSTLAPGEEVDVLISTTQSHISLVSKDIARYQKGSG